MGWWTGMDPATPTSEHLHPSTVLHCLYLMHLPSPCVWGCGMYGWALGVSRNPLCPWLLPLLLRIGSFCLSFSIAKAQPGWCSQGLLHPVFAMVVGQGQ